MKFAVYKLNFAAGVHLGTGTLASGANTLPADTLFSALCMEAAQQGEKSIKTLVDAVRQNRLRIGDLFPFIGEELYLPKPLVPVQRENEGNSIVKKSFKKLKYIPVSQLDTYLQGKIDPVAAVEKLQKLGAFEVRTMAASRSTEKLETGETLPYSVGVYRFGQGNGLYTIAGAEDTQTQNKFEQLLNALSYSGIGGKRSAGLGRFTVQKCSAAGAAESGCRVRIRRASVFLSAWRQMKNWKMLWKGRSIFCFAAPALCPRLNTQRSSGANGICTCSVPAPASENVFRVMYSMCRMAAGMRSIVMPLRCGWRYSYGKRIATLYDHAPHRGTGIYRQWSHDREKGIYLRQIREQSAYPEYGENVCIFYETWPARVV